MENVLTPGTGASLMPPMALQEGVASLSRGAYFKEAPFDMALSILCESAARMSGIERVGIWAFAGGQEELRCLELFELTPLHHSRGEVLQGDDHSAYFDELRNAGWVVTDRSDASPLAADYMLRHRIATKLDTPIHIRGELQGLLCLEQVGTCVPWTAEHRLFAQAVANLVTLALVEYEADAARQQAVDAEARLKAVFDASRDALLLADGDSGLILDANRQAEVLFGCARKELVGKHKTHLHRVADRGRVAELFRGVMDGDLRSAQQVEIQRSDGSLQPVEITTEVADVGGGRRLALGIFRPR